MPLVSARVSPQLKHAFAALAREHGTSESALLVRAVEHYIGAEPGARQRPSQEPSRLRKEGREVKFRLWADELAAAETFAEAEGITVPQVMVSLARRTLLKRVPFSPAELKLGQQAVAALGPIGRNLNTLVRYWHQTGKLKVEEIRVEELAEKIQAVRRELHGVIDRASTRYTPIDEGTP